MEHRPILLENYIINPKLKYLIANIINSAKKNNRLPYHILINGMPGTGKTTLAKIIANEMNVPLIQFLGTELNNIKQLAVLLSVPDTGAVVFIDEIHSVSSHILELFYNIMEDGEFQLGGKAKFLLPPITIIGATTEAAELPKPLIDRFVYKLTIPPYSLDEMSTIVRNMAVMFNISISNEAAVNIAKRSKNTPRIAKSILLMVKDHIDSKDGTEITNDDVNIICSILGLRENGLDKYDMKILEVLKNKKEVGERALANMVGITVSDYAKLYEPYLVREGYITITKNGRLLTDKGIQTLGVNYGNKES